MMYNVGIILMKCDCIYGRASLIGADEWPAKEEENVRTSSQESRLQ